MQIMLRAASAAVLNAAHEGIGCPYGRYVVGAGADNIRIIREQFWPAATGRNPDPGRHVRRGPQPGLPALI
jgi:hypothetical protein